MSKNLIGKVFLDQFRVESFIASGGMGAVYRVWDIKRSVALAMKVLHSELSDEPAIFKHFQREAIALKKLQHPNIVPLYGLYQTDRFSFMLQAYIDGLTLKEVLQERGGKPLTVQETLVILKALCAALGYAHANDVVHCDIKPGNVMVDRGGNIYLTDFGIARHAESTVTTLASVGTTAYMAPEQIRGEPVSPATDVYAIGVMLFEMLTGQRPFHGREAGAEGAGSTSGERIRYGHLHLTPPDPQSINRNIPAAFAQVVLKALEKVPNQRYSSTHELFSLVCSVLGYNPAQIPDRIQVQDWNTSPLLISTPPEPSISYNHPPFKEDSQLNRQIPGLKKGRMVVVWGGIALIAMVAMFAFSGNVLIPGHLITITPSNPMPIETKTLHYTRASTDEPNADAKGTDQVRQQTQSAKSGNETQDALTAQEEATQKAVLVPKASPSGANGPIKIAVLAPLSGPVPSFGVSTRDGAILAIEEWNSRGGVLGHQIEYIVEDSQCSGGPAVNAANKVIEQDGVKYIIGEVCSSASIPVSEIAEEKGIVQISPTSTNPLVTLNSNGTTKNYVFRACFIDPFQGLVMAKFALSQGHTKAFILLDQGNDYVRGLAEAFEENFVAGGGTIVGKESYTTRDTDFSATLSRVSDASADVLYVPDYYNVVNLIGAQAKKKGITAVLMGGDGWDSSDLDRGATDGGYYSNHYSPNDSRPIVENWIQKYESRFSFQPDAISTLAYDATNLLLAAIESAGVNDPMVVKDTLASIDYEAVSGRTTFDSQHNPIKNAAILQVLNGKILFVDSIAPNISSGP
jgi:branched-chain amino acid transport system substrate-binding protein